jgi:N-dimethylarginine dimethylaminohydrolase
MEVVEGHRHADNIDGQRFCGSRDARHHRLQLAQSRFGEACRRPPEEATEAHLSGDGGSGDDFEIQGDRPQLAARRSAVDLHHVPAHGHTSGYDRGYRCRSIVADQARAEADRVPACGTGLPDARSASLGGDQDRRFGLLSFAHVTAFGVWNDFGRLREVAVGNVNTAVIPSWDDSYRFLEPATQELVRRFAGQRIVDVPEAGSLRELVESNHEGLVAEYQRHGVLVHRPRPWTPDEMLWLANYQTGGHQVMPADPIWVIGRNVIECQFTPVARNKEVFPLRDLMQPLIDTSPEARHYAVPQSGPISSAGPRLEGGDILICGDAGRTVLVGLDPERSSNEAGIAWLKRCLLDDGWTIKAVPITQAAPIHLLGSLGIVGPESMLVCREGLSTELPAPVSGWDLIDITLDEARKTGPCVVMIDERTVLFPAETPRIGDELVRRELEAIPVPVAGLALLDGGIRCATFVMRRDQ